MSLAKQNEKPKNILLDTQNFYLTITMPWYAFIPSFHFGVLREKIGFFG